MVFTANIPQFGYFMIIDVSLMIIRFYGRGVSRIASTYIDTMVELRIVPMYGVFL